MRFLGIKKEGCARATRHIPPPSADDGGYRFVLPHAQAAPHRHCGPHAHAVVGAMALWHPQMQLEPTQGLQPHALFLISFTVALLWS